MSPARTAERAAGEIALRGAVEERQGRGSAGAIGRAPLETLGAAEDEAMLSRTLQESLPLPHQPVAPGLASEAWYLRGGCRAEVLGGFYDVFHVPAWHVGRRG
jgi:hypothetical protein